MEGSMIVKGSGRCSNCPCCCDIPLEIAVQFLAAFDLFYATTSLVACVTIFGLDIFAHRKVTLRNGTDAEVDEGFKPPIIGVKPIPLYVFQNKTTTTTEREPFTLRTTAAPIPYYDYDISDTVKLSKSYSKIAVLTERSHDFIERQCGREYILNYLFTHELLTTRAVYHEILLVLIFAEVLNIGLSICMLTTVCCFIEYKSSKVIVMMVWMFQWIPMFMKVYAIILSQSHRICILEFAWLRSGFKGQTFLFWILIIPLISYKPYEIVVLAFYIKEFLHLGFLLDEHLLPHAARGESEFQKNYFKEFNQLQAEKGLNTNLETSGFKDFEPLEVDSIQDIMRQSNDWHKRQQELHYNNLTRGDTRVQLKSNRKT